MNDQMTHAEAVSVIAEKQDEIETLRQKYDQALNRICNLEDMAASANAVIAEKDAEIERLTTKNLDWLAQWNKDQETIAANQLREQQLREALENHGGNYKLTKAECAVINALLEHPTDAAALRQMIEQAGEVMRERIMAYLLNETAYCTAHDVRTLPGVTLEDLKNG